MKINLNKEFDFGKVLEKESKERNIILTPKMIEKFELYKDLLLTWNEKINLTAIVDEYEIIMKHFIDCLELVKYIGAEDKVIDVGTGAGFPGIVIAIYFDGKMNITLLDALNKRIQFLDEVINKLELENVTLVHGRAEESAKKIDYREKYDIVVSRAVASLPVLLEYEVPYIKLNGKCLIMKGDNVETEIKNSKRALDILSCKINHTFVYRYQVYDEEYTRTILEIQKYRKTDNKYPRNNGQIKKNPL